MNRSFWRWTEFELPMVWIFPYFGEATHWAAQEAVFHRLLYGEWPA